MTETPASVVASWRAMPRRGFMLALGFVVAAFLFVQVRPLKWGGDSFEIAAPVYVPRLSVIGFDLADRDGITALIVRIRNSGKAVALDVNFALLQDEDAPASSAQQNSDAKKVSVDPDQEANFDLGSLDEHLLRWQGTCAGCYFLGLGKSQIMPVEAIAGSCNALIAKGKSCRLDYRLRPVVLRVTFVTAEGMRIEGGQPVYVYLSQTVESPHRIPKY